MIVFTDLDGTLLDHGSYSFDAALPAIARLRKAAIPIVPATSKTAAEVAPLMDAIGLAGPAIVENGGGIYRPGDETRRDEQYRVVRQALDRLPARLRGKFTGFGDMDDAGVASATGLPLHAARLARTRQFTEPGLFDGDGDELRDFLAALDAVGIRASRGGRFLTLAHGGHSKASRMREIRQELRAERPVVALGDAPNDRAMLEEADIAIIVRNPEHDGVEIAGSGARRLIHTSGTGPKGWNEAMQALLDEQEAARPARRVAAAQENTP